MDTSSAARTACPRPINGLALEALIQLDAVHPSILRFAHQTSPFRRQAIFLTLSALRFQGQDDIAARLAPPTPSPEPLADIAHALMTWRVRDIVHALYGSIDGLLGALNKLGSAPLEPIHYRTLVHLLSKPEHRARAKVLRQLEKITPDTLLILLRLPPAFVSIDLVQAFRSAKQAEEFNASVALIRQIVPNVTDADLLASIEALGPSASLASWAEKWVAKGQFEVSCPIHDNEEWAGLRSAKAMHDAASRYRNCLKTKVGMVAVGRLFYLEYKPAPAIVELISLSRDQWLLEGIYGPQNERVDPQMIKTIRYKLNAAGILFPARFAQASRFNKAARVLNIYGFDYDTLDEEDGVADLEDMITN